MTDKLSINNMSIEITRECNLNCAHCLRGEAQNVTIPLLYIDFLFQQVEYINILTITGGEPSLYPNWISYLVDCAKTHNVDIGNFYLATNAKEVSKEFLHSLIDLYMYCSENEISMVQISNDEFHDIDNEENIERLKCLRFVECKHEENYHVYDNKYLIKEGRASNFGERKNNKRFFPTSELDMEECEYYLNAKGYIINGCNWSYESQDSGENTICHITKFQPTMNAAMAEMMEMI